MNEEIAREQGSAWALVGSILLALVCIVVAVLFPKAVMATSAVVFVIALALIARWIWRPWPPKEGSLKQKNRPLALILAFLLIGAAGGSIGCASGNVTTSTGAVVPAATVESQDNIADLLHMVREAHRAYIATEWEPKKSALDLTTRAVRFKLLNDFANGLDASQALLIAWKQTNAGAAPGTILRPILATAPAFLDLAVSAHLLTQAQADAVKGVIASIPLADLNERFYSIQIPLAGGVA